MSGDILLSVENVSLSFGGVRAIADVSFDIRKGEVRAIIGPNGAGKTSMLNVVNGFYHPQRGEITYRGRTRARMKPHEAAEQGIARMKRNIFWLSSCFRLAQFSSSPRRCAVGEGRGRVDANEIFKRALVEGHSK